MKKVCYAVALGLVFVVTGIFSVLSYSNLSADFTAYKAKTNTILAIVSEMYERIDTLGTAVANLYCHVAMTQVNLQATDSLLAKTSKLATRNAIAVANQASKTKVLEKKVDLRARQTNDLTEMVFILAYGKNDSTGMAMYAQYQKCGNQALWDSAMVRLNPKIVGKINRIAEIDAKLAELEKTSAPTETSTKK
jgi:hypothetical protein